MKSLLTFFLILSVAFYSCKKDNEREEPIFSQNTVQILAGGTEKHMVTFNANNWGEFRIENLDPDIATAHFGNDGKVIIETYAIGQATIRAVCIKNDKVFCDLTVFSETLDGIWGDSPQIEGVDKIEEIIEMTTYDPVVEARISDDFHSYFETIRNRGFKFYAKTGYFYTIFSSNKPGIQDRINSGTYSWEMASQKLVLDFDEAADEEYTTEFSRESVIIIYQDFTDHYRELYPEAGITKVVFKRFLSRPILYSGSVI